MNADYFFAVSRVTKEGNWNPEQLTAATMDIRRLMAGEGGRLLREVFERQLAESSITMASLVSMAGEQPRLSCAVLAGQQEVLGALLSKGLGFLVQLQEEGE